MKYGKITNEQLKFLKQPIHSENGELFTNDESILFGYGYKKIVYTDPPEAEGFYPEPKWEETETEIVQVWELVPLPPEEATAKDYEEALLRLGVDFNE